MLFFAKPWIIIGSVLLLLISMTIRGTHAQIHGSLDWAGHTREYVKYIPNNSNPIGLIVALHGAGGNGESFCEHALPRLASRTGTVVVCPTAREGLSGEPCWKSFENHGYCFDGAEENSEDVDFLEELINNMKSEHALPDGNVLISGFSNGGSMAFRFNCEKSEITGGIVVMSQAWFDPYLGFYDEENEIVPQGTPLCDPQVKRPFYSAIGQDDIFYGHQPAAPGFEGVENWHSYSTQILGCTDTPSETSLNPMFPSCFEYLSCPNMTSPGVNIMCSVEGMGHDTSDFDNLLGRAFSEISSSTLSPTSSPAPTSSKKGDKDDFVSCLMLMILSLLKPLLAGQ